jgi:hypothetical protein
LEGWGDTLKLQEKKLTDLQGSQRVSARTSGKRLVGGKCCKMNEGKVRRDPLFLKNNIQNIEEAVFCQKLHDIRKLRLLVLKTRKIVRGK